MRIFFRTVVGVLVSVLMLSVGTATSQASSPAEVVTGVMTAADPQAAYEGLSAVERSDFDRYTMVVEETVELTSKPASDLSGLAAPGFSAAAVTACVDKTAKGLAKAIAGNGLYKWQTTIRYCGNSAGKIVSSKLTQTQGDSIMIGWNFDKVTDKNAGVSSGKAFGWAQYHFFFSVAHLVTSNKSPCQRIIAKNTGATSTDGQCSNSV